jgi:flagellar biosynthesis protein FlhG
VAVNLAAALRRKGRRVAVIDADFSLGNVDVLLGLTPTWNLGHLLAGDKTVPEVLLTLPNGTRVIPSGSGSRDMSALTTRQLSRFMTAMQELSADHDYLLIDTAAGLSDNVIDVITLADRVLVVVAPEPAAIVDAYAMIKVLTLADPARDIGVLVNGAIDAGQATDVFRQLDVAATHFLQRRLRYYGVVTHDPAVQDAVFAQQTVVDLRPQAAASICFQRLAARFTEPAVPNAGVLMFPPRPTAAPRRDPGGPLCA